MNLCRFQGFFLRHPRQNGRYPLGDHRLSTSRASDHQDIVAACRTKHDRFYKFFLPADFGKVQLLHQAGAVPDLRGNLPVLLVRGQGLPVQVKASLQEPDRVLKGLHRAYPDPGQGRRFAPVLVGEHNSPDTALPCLRHHGQNAVAGADPSVQRQFPYECVISKVLWRDLIRLE